MKIKFLRLNILTYVIVLTVVLFSIFLSLSLYQRNREDIYERKEDSIVNSIKSMTKYVLDAYDLYYDSGTIKFQEIISNLLAQNKDLANFQIIKMDGTILFDSRYASDFEEQQRPKTDLDINIIHSNQIYLGRSGKDQTVAFALAPHIDDWGNHLYSVSYFLNYDDVDKELGNLKNFFYLVGGSVVGFSLLILTFFRFSQSYQIQREKAAKLEEVNRVKDEFMILTAHNLRTPLTVIKGYLSLLSDPDLKNDTQNLEGAQEGVQQLSTLVEDIILATSILSGDTKFSRDAVEIGEVLEEVKRENQKAADEKNITIRISFDGKKDFTGDRMMIKRVFTNLVDNAIKFNKPGGTVNITINNFSDLRFIITDTGSGIAPDKIKTISSFFHHGGDILTSDFEGEGMGLYLTNLIAKHYNGELMISSEGEGKGTKVELKLRKK